MSGAILMLLAMGGQKRIALTGATVDDPGGVRAGVRFGTDGVVSSKIQSTYAALSNWIDPPPPGSIAVEIKATVTSGSGVSGDALDTWLSLSAAQSREWVAEGPTALATIDVTIRNLAQNPLTTATYQLQTNLP
jgi:hypothetical protein